MSLFGTPRRTVAQDANEGVVTPPRTKVNTSQPLQLSSQLSESEYAKGMTGMDDAVQSFGASLGNALVKTLDNKVANMNEQKVLDAQMRQGTDKAVNSIDKMSKRTGWEEAIFGQDVSYRAAQQQAVMNGITDMYIQSASRLDDFAGSTPEEYQETLKQDLDKLLEPYENDEETKAMVTAQWANKSRALAGKQMESHYAYTQTQAREQASRNVAQTFDEWTVNAELAVSPEDHKALVDSTTQFFKGKMKPANMTDMAYHSVINEQIQNSLRKGNIGAYNAAKANGWLKDLNVKDQVAMDRAISAYDTDFTQNIQVISEESALAALEAKNIDEAIGVYQSSKSRIKEMEARSSGTERAQLAIARGMAGAERAAQRAAKSVVKAEAKAERNNLLKEAIRTEDPIDRAGKLSALSPKKKELGDVMDVTVMEDVSRLTGSTTMLTQRETVNQILTDPNVAQKIAQRFKSTDTNYQSPLVKQSLETMINGWENLLDEDGQLNERGHQAMASMGHFAANETSFKNMIGKENYDRYEMLTRGLQVGQNGTQIKADLDAYNASQGEVDNMAIDWDLPPQVSKREYIQGLIQRYTGEKVNGDTLAEYTREYTRALTRIYKGDKKSAEEYLRISALNNNVHFKGVSIRNSKQLNEATDYNFKELMEGVTASNDGAPSIMSNYLYELTGLKPDDEPNLSLDRINNWNMYTIDGVDGFFLDAPQAKAPVRFSTEDMKRWEAALDQRNAFKQMHEEAKKEVEVKSALDSILESKFM